MPDYTDAMDVTKQKDMTGFYRNLYKQTVGTGPEDNGPAKKETAEPVAREDEPADTTASVDVKTEVDSPSKEGSKSEKAVHNKRCVYVGL